MLKFLNSSISAKKRICNHQQIFTLLAQFGFCQKTSQNRGNFLSYTCHHPNQWNIIFIFSLFCLWHCHRFGSVGQIYCNLILSRWTTCLLGLIWAVYQKKKNCTNAGLGHEHWQTVNSCIVSIPLCIKLTQTLIGI